MINHLAFLALVPLLIIITDTGPYRPPSGSALWSPGPGGGPAVLVPVEFARDAVNVAACESNVAAWDAVGKQGELGVLQVHPVHFPQMQRLGLDPWLEGDRIKYAVRLWERSGWGQWSCKP